MVRATSGATLGSSRGSIARQLRMMPRQLRNSWYILFFQLPAVPERVLPRVIRRLWRDWGPSGFDTRAELAAALAAHRRGSRVILLSKAAETATFYAQGGIAVVLPDGDDSVDAHVTDTLVAGAGLCDADAVRFWDQTH